MKLKQTALQLCTCTWIEIMTGAGIALYLSYLQNYWLAAIAVMVFAPLIGFHFAVTGLSKDDFEIDRRASSRLIKIRGLHSKTRE